jgi:RHH-type proline utilization regulon transcriptional repressor/proline dehydrogenase/delta 1-pyrroline-5-carboxylate dehydrogenase
MSAPTVDNTSTAPASALELPSDDVLVAKAEARALALLEASLADTSRSEASSSKRLARLLGDDAGRDLLLDLTDQVLRIRDRKRAAERLHDLTDAGVPASLGGIDRLGLATLGKVAPAMPWVSEQAVDWRIGKDTADVILAAEEPAFSKYVRRRTGEGFRVNLNLLGEAILGNDEAEARCSKVLDRIRRPDVDYVSVKISAICANLDVLAEEDSLARIEEQLVELYRAARDASPRTFVNLDMEEYRDLELSLQSFTTVLDREEFDDLSAGIVLQAYIPDSHSALVTLVDWANARYARTGTGVKVRLVKGANLAMEEVEAELHDWHPAPYPSKADVDASYKAMLEYALLNATPGALRMGVASHNLFEVAWALTLRDELNAHDRLEIEMLEGMAPPQSRAVRNDAGGLLLYSPIVEQSERDASIAYLSRRLDENSSPENFLRALFDLQPGSPEWHEQAQRFRTSVSERHSVTTLTRRNQDRTQPIGRFPVDGSFHNVADTDFTVPVNRRWLQSHLDSYVSQPPALVETIEGVDSIIADAKAAQAEWAQTSWAMRRTVLAQVAEVLEERRGEAIAAEAHVMGKTVRESDPEISEGIDFVTFAAHLTLTHEQYEKGGLTWEPHKVTVVAGPWNFPYAIPLSGLVHAIAAGGAAILKPAPEAREVGALLVDSLHQAGVPEHLVQLACTPDNEVGQRLITHDDVDLVMLTGSLETADLFTSWKPSLRINAETSGKNAMVITAAADIDQAIKELVKSAFGHAGQKCSAASLAIIEASVYDDPSFHVRLADAVRSLKVGPATDLSTIMGPLIAPARGPLERALTTLEPGETWLVEPQQIDEITWTPGVRRDVKPGSWFHLTECFGPVLGLMRADNLEHAVELQNAPIYGLTGGIQSLDPKEIEYWRANVQCGNAYINRHITGAIVRRQPFGGWKRSSVGSGTKPGGPDHLNSYGTWTRTDEMTAAAVSSNLQDSVIELAVVDYEQAWNSYFSLEHDPTSLACESNILRYRPLDLVIARVDSADSSEVPLLRAAALITGTPLELSNRETESDEHLAARIACLSGDVRLRLLTKTNDDVLRAANSSGVTVDDSSITGIGRLDLLRFLKEQAISQTMHRYGRLTGK